MTAVNYATGSSTTMSDFVTALFSFATGTAGWTQLDLDTANGEASMHKGGTLFIQFRWATTTPEHLGIYQALGYGLGLGVVNSITTAGTGYVVGDVLTLSGASPTTAATVLVTSVGGSGELTGVRVLTAGINYNAAPSNPVSLTGGSGSAGELNCSFRGTASSTVPGESCDDSGSSLISGSNSNLEDSRCLYDIGDGPYTSHHFFAGTNAAGDPYLHVVLELSPGVFRHMGFGHQDKIGDWVGGEYCYGHIQTSSSPISVGITCLLDGLWNSTTGNTEYRGATVRMENFLTQDPTGKWGVCWNNASGTGLLDDREGNPRVRVSGGFRAGLVANGVGFIASNLGNAFVPMYGITSTYWDPTTSPDQGALMGSMPDVRGVNTKAFTPKQVITIGSEDWMVFPLSRKAYGSDLNDSKNSGIAYLRP